MEEIDGSKSDKSSVQYDKADHLRCAKMSLAPGLNEVETLVPTEWIGPRTGRAVVIVGYEVQGLPASQYSAPLACDLKDVRVFFWKGEVGYRDEVKVHTFWVDEHGRFNVADPEPTKIVKAPDGIYSLFMSPYTVVDGGNAGELIAEGRIEIAIALFGSFQGRNVVYRKIYTNTYSFDTRRAAATSEAIPVPLSFPQPMLTPEGVRPVLMADESIWTVVDAPVRNRVHLSLRWLRDAMFDIGVNAYLKYWLAIETLAMPTTTDIRPLNDILCSIYGLRSRSEVNRRFYTGLLFGLRSRIVHDGRIVPLDGRILRYCECMHHDVLRYTLNLPSERRVEQLIRASQFDYEGHLRTLSGA